MKFSTKSRYALRLMIQLALSSNGGAIPLKNISRDQNISLKYLEHIVSLMTKAGLVLSIRGAHGGYWLAKKASDITAFDILQATEGGLATISCLESGNACNQVDLCPTVNFWRGLQETIHQHLRNTTLEDLASAQGEKAALNYAI